jgi:hypothetical protein
MLDPTPLSLPDAIFIETDESFVMPVMTPFNILDVPF